MIRVLIVDDSPAVRSALSKALAEDAEIEVLGTAPNPIVALEMLQQIRPDVVTCDVEMPGMDGLQFLQQVMRTKPLPVVICSSKARRSPKLVLEALQAGAVAVVPKPHADYPLPRMIQDLKATLKAAALSKPRLRASPPAAPPPPPATVTRTARPVSVIAVGSSTGGTVAFETFARGLPPGHPCVVVAQHLPTEFVPRFADRLNEVLASKVSVAQGGESLVPGHIYVAPGTHHLRIRREGVGLVTELWDADNVNFHKPSCDVLLTSVATVAGRGAVGVILTGMGADGARGLLAMRRSGAATLAQDEATSVVYGMPRAAMELGAAEEQLPLEHLAGRIGQMILATGARSVARAG